MAEQFPSHETDELLDQAVALAQRQGVGAGEVVEVAGGVANRGFVLGERLFVRVARAGFEDDLRKETSVVPVARSAGVLTPAILEYDESGTVIDAPYVVMERVHGTEPTTVPTGLAEQLARLHRVESPAIPGLPVDGWGDPWKTVDGLAADGYVDIATAKWLGDWFTRLDGRFDRAQPSVLIHGDVASHNLLASADGELAGLIDWGDAAQAPRAMDFAKLPLEQVAEILPNYIRHSTAARRADDRGEADERVAVDELAAAIVWFHLGWALGKLTAAPWPGQRHWTAPTASRLLGLLRFFSAAPPEPWASLRGRPT